MDAGITGAPGSAELGYNTTAIEDCGGGEITICNHLRVVPQFAPNGGGVVQVTFTPTAKLQAWGAFFTGIEGLPNTKVTLVFDDGTSQVFDLPEGEGGGAAFFGFTDPGKSITSVTVREQLDGPIEGCGENGCRDIFGIDDVRYVAADESTQEVPAGQPAVVTVRQDGNGDGTPSPIVGVDIPAGAFNEDVTVTVRLVDVPPSAECHDFLIGQTGQCIEITAKNAAGADAALNAAVTVGVCLHEDPDHPEHIELEMFKFDTPTGRALPLQQVAADFLDCSDLTVASAQPRNWLEGLAMAASKRVGKWVSPKLAYAADRGFGGKVPASPDGFSIFTWAEPVLIERARLAVNLLRSGRDVYTVNGTFDFSAKTFAPFAGESGFNPANTTPAGIAANTVIISYGNIVQTIPPNKFKKVLGRWVYNAPPGNGPGVKSLLIYPVNGNFVFDGTALTEGVGTSPDATYRPFSIQIGHRIQGGGLECGEAGRFKCTLQH